MEHYITPIRLARTRDGRLVPYEHPEAAYLAYIPGQAVPMAEAVAAGLVATKQADAVEDKQLERAEDKSAVAPEAKREQTRIR